jgi:hypothetical protein
MLDLLGKNHRAIVELASRLEACLEDGGPLAITRLGQLQWALAREMMCHAVLMDRLARQAQGDGDPSGHSTYEAGLPVMRSDPMLVRLQAHVHRWGAGAMMRDRAGYAEAVRALLGLVRHRLALEERILHPRFDRAKALGADQRRRVGDGSTPVVR